MIMSGSYDFDIDMVNGRFVCNTKSVDRYGMPWDERDCADEYDAIDDLAQDDVHDGCLCPFNDRCYVCADGLTKQELRERWQDQLESCGSGASAFERLTDSQFDQVLTDSFADIPDPHSVIGFDDRYVGIASAITSGDLAGMFDVVIDFGCGRADQAILFEGVDYIGVDDFFDKLFDCEWAEHHVMPAQDFVKAHAGEFDQSRTLALCLNVPDEEARRAVIDGFANHLVHFARDTWDTVFDGAFSYDW